MRARRLAVITSLVLLAFGGGLYACSTTPGGPLGLIDHDDAAPPFESGVATDTSTPDTSSPEDAADAADGDASVSDADSGASDADAADAADGDAADGS